MKYGIYLALSSAVLLSNVAMAHEVPDAMVSEVNITVQGDYRYISSNGIPTSHGPFPNPGNPNSISAQSYQFRLPLAPVMPSQSQAVTRGANFGVALNGIPFDPLSADFWNEGRRTHEVSSWNYEAMRNSIQFGLDHNNAHVQPNGAYHYHGLPKVLYQKLSLGKTPPDQMVLIGYAADGFPMYGLYGHTQSNDVNSPLKLLTPSFQLKAGARPQGAPPGHYDGTFVEDYDYVEGAGDLDQCNGRQGVTPEYPKGTYYYMVSNRYPYIPHCYRGTPDPSFVKPRPPMGGHP